MKNVFQRLVDLDKLDKELFDYTPVELAAYMTTHYPGDPTGALDVFRDNVEIGRVLAQQTRTLLEGWRNDKRDRVYQELSQ